MTSEEIIALIQKAKDLGLTSLKVDGLEFSIATTTVTPASKPAPVSVPEMKAEDLCSPLSMLDEMSDEEVFYWATPYYDELQAKKEAHQKALGEKNVD